MKRSVFLAKADPDAASAPAQSIKTINVKNVNLLPSLSPPSADSHPPCLLGHRYKAGHQKLICSVSLPH